MSRRALVLAILPLAILLLSTLPLAACEPSPAVDAGPQGGGPRPDAGEVVEDDDAGVDRGADAGADDLEDAGPAGDAGPGPADGGPDDGGLPCDLSSTIRLPGGGPLGSGQLCDRLWVCVDDDGAAARQVAPWLDCETATSSCGATTCVYVDGDAGTRHVVIDDALLEDVCALLALEPPPTQIGCILYE